MESGSAANEQKNLIILLILKNIIVKVLLKDRAKLNLVSFVEIENVKN